MEVWTEVMAIIQRITRIDQAPKVEVKEFNGENSLTVLVNGKWIAYDLNKEQAKFVFEGAVLALQMAGFVVQVNGESLFQ